MDAVERSELLAREGQRLLAVAEHDFGAAVPSCPGWTVRDLVAHIGNIWQAIDVALANRSTEPPDFGALATPPDDDDGLLSFAGAALPRLVTAIATADPTQPIWTWSGDQTVGFFQRRAHHETLVHRVDAELALDDRTPIEPGDALDGIDELFSVLVSATGPELPSGSFHLHQTDGDGEFMLAVIDGSISVTREHAKGDAALRGSAEDLWLAMWRRGEMQHMELFGDEDVAMQWTDLAP